ncbi:DEAD/DEAH box helicase [Shouchella shacheensis]|uniref:DEAD/DEAH box helicase n=1 Tax=Shouchella shacheensis TaxID=1649580 RepID=UPI00074013E0|nr:DEAD/DEAH box helicase [Shouchella shacheensis]
MATFEEFGLNEKVVQAVTNMGFTEATPIQTETISLVLDGRDVIGQAQTGTGKTGAFGIPLIHRIDQSNPTVQGLVIAPTRELANQVDGALKQFGRVKGVRTTVVYGGEDFGKQIRSLKQKPHIIVATPGRLLDHMRRHTIRLGDVSTVVLDEADEMLNMGFIEDIETILAATPEETRQTLLFSATMPRRMEALASKFMNEPTRVAVKAKEVTMENIAQQVVEVHEKEKFDVFCRLLDLETPELSIVFGRTKRRVDELSEALIKRGYRAEGLHGDLNQAKRNSVLRKFKEGLIDVLVATDVAARGLDISGVTHVFNFDLPQDPESYVHRIGRTGRAGKSGIAITLATKPERDHVQLIEKVSKKRMTSRPKPTLAEALEGQKQVALNELRDLASDGEQSDYRVAAKELLQETDAVTAVSAALKLLTKEPDQTPVKLTGEAPLRAKKRHGGHSGGGRRRDNRRPWPQKRGRDDRRGGQRKWTNHSNRSGARRPS